MKINELNLQCQYFRIFFLRAFLLYKGIAEGGFIATQFCSLTVLINHAEFVMSAVAFY